MPNAETLPVSDHRIEYLDYLRVIATMAVVLLHISIQGWGDVDVQSGPWMVYNVWNGLVRWCVPVFVMISGALFLNPKKKVSVYRLWTRNIPRILSAFLFWSVIFGVAMKSASEASKNFLNDVSDAVTKTIRWVINFAPFGIMGLMYNAISTSGIAIFTDYGKLVLLLVGCMLVSALVVNPLIAFICIRRNPYPLVFKCLKNSGITAFFTRSSAANIPVNLELCEDLGLNKEIYSVSIPLGATINMDGAAITITVMTLAAAHTLGIHVFLPVAVLLSIMAALGAAGTSGVAGGSLLLIPMACSLFGISADVAMQVVGVGFIVGVIQDSMETMINSSSDVLFTAVAEYRQKRIRGEDFHF